MVKLWAKRSYQTANYVVTFGFLIGALPVTWNIQKHAMEPISSRFNKYRWIITILWIIIWQIILAADCAHRIYTAEDKFEYFTKDPLRFCISFGLLAPAFLHLHTAWKYKEFAVFINRAAQFYEYFQNRYATKEERRGYTIEDTISGLLKVFFLSMTLLISSFFVVAYNIQCSRHVLYYVLPVCGTGYPLFTKIIIKTAGSLFQFHYIAMNAAGMILYVDLFAAVILMGLYIVRQMRDVPTMSRRTVRNLLEPDNWFKCFRCLELTVKQLNDCIGELFMPLHMLVIVVGGAGIVFNLMRYDFGIMLTLIHLILLVGIGIYYKFLIGRGSKFCQASANALQMSRLKMKTKYDVGRYRACKELRPNVGGLFPLKQKTVTTMIQATIEIAIDLLLT